MQDDQQHKKIDSVIELAMSRLEQRSPASVATEERKQQERLDFGRRGYDLALAKRLDGLRTVMGNNEAVVPPAPQPVAAAGPTAPSQGFRTGTLFATALISALAGAGTMWLAIGSNPQPAAPSQAPTAHIVVPMPPEVVATASAVAAPAPTDDDQVRRLVESWRSAWAGRDIDTYLACYSTDFSPAGGQKHAAWLAARRKNISSRRSIDVATNDLQFERLDAQRMKARFLQDYASGGYRETAQAKTLLLVRNDTGWKIAGEWQGEAPAGRSAAPERGRRWRASRAASRPE